MFGINMNIHACIDQATEHFGRISSTKFIPFSKVIYKQLNAAQ
uniref:Uncharacterized protein n=1 Tax=Rhizophora mucronata TaxID=61149 RepID=A0A2P2QB53_RHIMU